MNDSYTSELFGGLLAGTTLLLIMIVFFVCIFFAVGFFLLRAFSLYRIAERRGIEHPYLAWIPFAQEYLYAEIIGENLTIGTKTIQQFPWVYIAVIFGVSIVSTPFAMVPIIGPFLRFLIGIAVYVASIYVMYRFFKIFKGGNEVVFTVICAIFPIVFPFILLFLRNTEFTEEEALAVVTQ